MSEFSPKKINRSHYQGSPRKTVGERERRLIHQFRQLDSATYKRFTPEPIPFQKALARVSASKTWSPRGNSVEDRVREAWGQLVGERLAKRCWPLRLKNGVLHIAVKDSIAVADLTFRKTTLLHLIRGLPGLSELQDVKFSLGEEEG